MLPLLLPLLPPLLLDHAERVLLVLAQVGVLRHDPLDQDGQHERPLVLQPTQLVEGRVADLRRKSIALFAEAGKKFNDSILIAFDA